MFVNLLLQTKILVWREALFLIVFLYTTQVEAEEDKTSLYECVAEVSEDATDNP